MNFTTMDFETTNSHPESACSPALAMVRGNETVDRFYTVTNLQMPFDGRNIRVHGITTGDVKNTPAIAEVWPKIKRLYQPGMLVATHNTRFDCRVMEKSLARYNIPTPHYFAIDTLATSKALGPDLPNHKLDTVSGTLNINLQHHHDALGGSEACAGVLIEENKRVGDDPIKKVVKPI